MIRVKSINKYYNKNTKHENHVINDISLELPKTGLVCILGESGSGKTTLLNCIGKLDTFASGGIEIEGKEYSGRVGRAAERMRNSSFAYVFQNYFLIHDQTVYENLMLALSLFKLSDAEKEERVDYVLEALDMVRYKKRKVSMLSGGQQQRVAIARALIKSPDVIFADEPTGNLDEANTVRVMNILKKLSKNCLVLLATHEKRIAKFYADSIITVVDGKIQDIRTPDATQELIRFDDHDLYLDEFKHEEFGAEGLELNYYAQDGFDEDKLELTIIRRDGNIYISAPNGLRVERLDERSSVKIIKGKRPVYKREDAAGSGYSLKKLQTTGGSRLKIGRLFSMAKNSISTMGSKLAIPIVAMILTAVLCMFAVADYMTLANMKPEDFIVTDSRLLSVSIARGEGGFSEYIEPDETPSTLGPGVPDMVRIMAALDESGLDYKLFTYYSIITKIYVEGFYQVANVNEKLTGFTYAPMSLISESDLIMGHMPEECYDVVVDRWVLDKFLEGKNPTAQSMTSIENFLGRSFNLSHRGIMLRIVGICDTHQPNIYVDDVSGTSFGAAGTRIASLENLQRAYPGQYDDVVLTGNDALVCEQLTSYRGGVGVTIQTSDGTSVVIAGTFPDEFPANIVVGEELYNDILKGIARFTKKFTVFTDDKEAFKRFLNNELDSDLYESSIITITDDYANRMWSYQLARTAKLNARTLVTLMITIMSFIMLYITMRGNAMQKLREIAVYRLLGMKKISIVLIFVLQILAMSMFTTLIGGLATAGVLDLLSNIKTMNYDFVVTWGSTLITIAALFVMNIITGVLPVIRLISIPPAQLAAKYDL